MPFISVLMPVYNTEKYLDESIKSILNQTYKNFEFIIIDDGSEDQSCGIIESYKKQDNRIRLIAQENHQGIVSVLNQGLDHAKGKYIIRMDADDISVPERIEKQVDFMEKHPEIDVAGSSFCFFHQDIANTESYEIMQEITEHEEIILNMFFQGGKRGGFCYHPTIILRKKILDTHAFKYDDLAPVEDIDLWFRMSPYCKFANLPQVLLYYRRHPQQSSQQDRIQFEKAYDFILKKNFQNIIVPQASPEESELYLKHKRGSYQVDKAFLQNTNQLFWKIYQANQKHQIFPEKLLKNRLGGQWFVALNRSTHLGLPIFWMYLFSSLRKFYPIGFKNLYLFFLDCMLKRPSRYLRT